MSAENFSQFIHKKAYEICYAVFRMILGVKHAGFAAHLEDKGLLLLASAVSDDYERALSASKSLEYLLRMGADVNILNTINADLVSSELMQFNSAIADLKKSESPLPVDLNDIFSKLPAVSTEDRGGAVADRGFSRSMVEAAPKSGLVPSNNNGGVRAAMRQASILEKIRQSDSCRLKDLQDHFMEASERTIRYDIQDLIERGLVERLGNGGPSTYYKAKEQQTYES
ncbi:MAG: DeoR family transcriptional regulator [Candidatus Liptonbacteria bacterium]|nr:DeoR family transcriptional regulator [Parcubacteria group bacterium]MBI4087376.1 DeoR family transcriptional regulator [Candidatus Liptonbacteria bacterium]